MLCAHTHNPRQCHTSCADSQAVRDSEWEGREIARTRNSQEQIISLDTPYFDICRIQVA